MPREPLLTGGILCRRLPVLPVEQPAHHVANSARFYASHELCPQAERSPSGFRLSAKLLINSTKSSSLFILLSFLLMVGTVLSLSETSCFSGSCLTFQSLKRIQGQPLV